MAGEIKESGETASYSVSGILILREEFMTAR
jgi:hypothetical protein